MTNPDNADLDSPIPFSLNDRTELERDFAALGVELAHYRTVVESKTGLDLTALLESLRFVEEAYGRVAYSVALVVAERGK